ncbi:MAG TPA: IS200/IS605 family transposase [Planctomycetota bacterium]|nr:IS200/IS605 family transposase [Planctomycetota bacterium]HRR81150.1 IS200/IS605 family transposase [Planctomycetota bacterium]HRT94091.1 IS200/IS605 family transposase [Planctomycetota bacterium]
MSHTFTQLTCHAVFATKGRREMIKDRLRSRLYHYLVSTINNQLGFAREVGGTANHLHVLFDVHQSVAVADAIRVIKSVSSGWIHETFPDLRDFAWQEGYGAFSVSASLAFRVRAYIQGQEEHHRRRSFEDEFVALLKKHGIAYDPAHLWD